MDQIVSIIPALKLKTKINVLYISIFTL